MHQVPTRELGPVGPVRRAARWRGGRVLVADEVEPGVHGSCSDDADLAQREGHYGHQHDGWRGLARADELTEVATTVTILHEYGDPPPPA